MRPRPSFACLIVMAAFGLAGVSTLRADTGGGSAVVPLRVMTFNIRNDAGFGSWSAPNGWLYTCGPRRDRAVNTIRAAAPDIFGVQEALWNQVIDLKNAFPGYGFYGVGRNDGGILGEFSAIFFRSGRFTLADSGTFWLSETPEVPGTVFACSGSIRIASWTILDDAGSGARLFVLNTHWDNVCQDSRERSAALVREKIGELAGGLPVIVMGDLNTTETSAAFLDLIGRNDPGGLALADAFRSVFPVRQADEATFHGFNGTTAGSRIDFVLPTAFFTPVDAAIDRTGFSCGWPSDHYPVVASFDVPGALAGRNETGLDAAGTPDPPADPCIPGCVPPACASVPAQGSAWAVPPALIGLTGGLALLAFLRLRRRRSR
jgi:endonuclease/exonuclease/phosphatase family metal-dependent hydrolase